LSITIYIILYLGAPLVSDFYEQEILTNLLRVLSLVFVINSFSYVQEAKLKKELKFKTLSIVHIPSTIIGGVVSVIMAMNSFGVLSIVALQLITRLAYSIQIWLYSKWQPLFILNFKKTRQLFSFGSKLMLSGVLNAVFQNSYQLVIGKFFPLSTVGYYQNA